MLARALWHTGVAGFAEDYFADAFVLDYFERWGSTPTIRGSWRRVMCGG